MKLRQTTVCLIFAATVSAQTPTTPVILISIDTLRADHLSAYGYTRIHTPNIDSLADHGTLFTQADCQIPFTMPSHASMLTSIYPFENQVEENAVAFRRARSRSPPCCIRTAIRPRRSSALSSWKSRWGSMQGFDFYDSPFNYDAFSPMSGSMFLGVTPGNPNAGKDRRDGALVVRAAAPMALRQCFSSNDRPCFAFVHLFDMHKPYNDGYDGQLAYVDRLIGLLKQTLVQTGLWDKALVILVARSRREPRRSRRIRATAISSTKAPCMCR